MKILNDDEHRIIHNVPTFRTAELFTESWYKFQFEFNTA